MQVINHEAQSLQNKAEKLEGTIASLNEQLDAARQESKALKAENKSTTVLETSLKKEQARAEVCACILSSLQS